MELRAIFSKPVDRTIEGVIKADDEASLRIALSYEKPSSNVNHWVTYLIFELEWQREITKSMCAIGMRFQSIVAPSLL